MSIKDLVPIKIKVILKRWIKNLFLLKEKIDFEVLIRRYTPVLVYTPPKVGSSSIYRSLINYYKGAVVKNHEFFGTEEDYHLYKFKKRKLVHRWTWKVIRLFKYNISKRKLNVVVIIRNPFERNMSAFFNNFERDVGVPFDKSEYSIKDLIDIFFSVDSGGNYHFFILDWFQDHIEKNFNINVYDTVFPKKGYMVYAKDNIRLLVLKLETPDEVKVDAIKTFLNLEKFEMIRDNSARDFDYYQVYQKFKNEIKFPDDYSKTIIESTFLKHFYTTNEIAEMKKKWSK